MTTPATLNANTVIHQRYRIVRLIGQGDFGAVYEAIDQRLGTTVTLKQTIHRDPQRDAAFEREAKLLASLRHPTLPHISDYFTNEHGLFLVMEFIPGDDLVTLLRQRGVPFLVSVAHAQAQVASLIPLIPHFTSDQIRTLLQAAAHHTQHSRTSGPYDIYALIHHINQAEVLPANELADLVGQLCLTYPGLVGRLSPFLHIHHLERFFQAMRDNGWVVDITVAKRLLYQVDTLLQQGAITEEVHRSVVTRYDLERVRQVKVDVPD